MDIEDLKAVLPDSLQYIMFDACSMASMEVLFELKDKTNYILASPSEVISSGFPYDTLINNLFEGVDGLKRATLKFTNYNKSQTGDFASATVSLIDTKKLGNIALFTKELLKLKKPVSDYCRENLQYLNFQDGTPESYDFKSFLENNYSSTDINDLINAIDSAVIFKDHTPTFFGNPIDSYCGISVYVPRKTDTYKSYYSTLDWAQQSDWVDLL